MPITAVYPARGPCGVGSLLCCTDQAVAGRLNCYGRARRQRRVSHRIVPVVVGVRAPAAATCRDTAGDDDAMYI